MDNKDKQALINGTATIPYKIHVLNDDGNIKDTLTEEDIVSTDYEDYRYVDSSSLCIGQFVARKLKGEVKVIDKDLQIEDNEISVEMGVNRNDGSKEYALSIDGKSEQETTKGNQLIDFSNYEFIDGDTTSTFSNDVLTVSNTAGTYRSVKWNILDLAKANPGKTLYFTFEKYDYSNCPAPAVNIRQVLNGNATYHYLVNSKGYCTAVTIPTDVDNLTEFRIRVMSNNSSTSQAGTLKITKPMLQFGTSKLEYEPYTGGQPSPNPDYPSEIKTVKGVRNLFKGFNLKVTSNYGITFNYYEDGSISAIGTSTGTALSMTSGMATKYKFLLKAGTYTLSGGKTNIAVEVVKLDGVSIASTSIYKTFTIGEDTEVFVRLAIGKDKTINETIKPMLEEGSTSHDYVPYGSWLKVKDSNYKNIFDLDNIVVGYGLNDNNGGSYTASNRSYLDYTEIKSNAYYSITNITPKAIQFFDENKTFISALSGVTEFTTPDNAKYIRIAFVNTDTYINGVIIDGKYEQYKETSTLIDMNKPNLFDKDNVEYENGGWISAVGVKGNGGDNKLFKMPIDSNTTYTITRIKGNRFRVGTYTTDSIENNTKFNVWKISDSATKITITSSANDKWLYVQYMTNDTNEQEILDSIKIYEGIDDYYELSSIGDKKDILTIQNGQANINQKIGKIVLDGSESGWNKNYASSGVAQFYISLPNCIAQSKLISTHFINGKEDNKAYINGFRQLVIINPFNNDTSLVEWKTWLSENPVTVYYILAEPQTIELPRINKIESIDNTENISIVTNIPTTFQITEFPLVNWYNLGNFLITKPTDDDVKGTLTFDSMDYTKKFNQTFDSTNIIFPCTALELAKYCCEQCGVELATTDFINNDFEVIDNQYTEEDTYRNVMQDIGKLAYSWVRIGWDNKCYIDFTYGTEVDEYNKITNDNYYDLEIQQKVFGPVNRVIIGMSDVEGENVYIEDEESISKYGATEIQIYDNNLTYTPELRNQAITNAKCLFGLTYTPMTLNTTGHPWLLGNEKCEVTYMDGTKQYTYPWDRTISYSGHIKTKLESKCDTKTETEYKYKGDVETLLNKTRIIVNKQEGTITSLTQTTETIQNNLQQNYYDRTQTNQLIQTSSTGITNTFSEAGGNNIFRNTGLWFEDSSTSYYIYPKSDLYPSNKTFTNGQRAYEFWDGLVLKEYYDKAANLTSLLLQNGYFEQKQQVPNGNYTVSFKYKKLIESATTKVIINNVEYNLTKLQDTEFRTGEQDSDGNYITQPLEVTDGYIFVRFYTNVNNSTIIYDLMVNAGSVKLAYSQNQNETTTDTVNISKGITITSSNTDTTFKANSDGIRTLNKNNETLSEFTDKGMKNKQIEVTDEATIVQVLWQNVGDQTWLTRL